MDWGLLLGCAVFFVLLHLACEAYQIRRENIRAILERN